MVTVSSAVYHDRKMLKWLPFQSLPEQGKSLRALREKRLRRPKPTLSEDRLEMLQRALESALANEHPLRLTVHEAGAEKTIEGLVTDVDFTTRRLCIDTTWINASDIIDTF